MIRGQSGIARKIASKAEMRPGGRISRMGWLAGLVGARGDFAVVVPIKLDALADADA